MENYDKYQDLLKVSEESAGTAEKKYESYQESIAALNKELQSAWENLANNQSIADFIQMIIKGSTWAVKAIPAFVRALSPIIGSKLWSTAVTLFSGHGLSGIGASLGKIFGFSQKSTSAVETNTQALNELTQQLRTGKSGGGSAGVNTAIMASGGGFKYNNRGVGQGEDGKWYYLKADGTVGKKAVAQSGQTALNSAKKQNSTKWRDRGVGSKIAAGVGAGLMAGLTASTETADIYGTGSTEVNSTLSTIDKVSTGAVTGIVTAVAGPLAGALANTVMDIGTQYLMPVLEKWFFKEEFYQKKLQVAVDQANDNLEIISDISDSLDTLSELSQKEILVGDDYNDAVDAFNELTATIYDAENTDDVQYLWQKIVDNTDSTVTSLSQLRQEYLNGTQEDREKITQELQAASELVAAQQNAVTYSLKLHNIQTDINNAAPYSKDLLEYLGLWDTYEQFVKDNYKIRSNSWTNYASYGSGFFNMGDSAADDALEYSKAMSGAYIQEDLENNYELREALESALTSDVLINYWQETIDSLTDQLASEDLTQDKIDELQTQLSEANGNLSDLKTAYSLQQTYIDEINEEYAAAAFTASGLSLLTSEQLKSMDYAEIIKMVADELTTYGYNKIDGGGNISAQAQTYIEQAIRGNEKVYGIVSGQSYTLSEMLDENNAGKFKNYTETQLQWASALGVSIDRLKELQDTLGDVTLAQVLQTPEETRNSISELGSIFTSIASSSGITVENIETIVSKFPELLQYAGEVGSLTTSITQQMNTLSSLYAYQITDQILNSEEVMEEIKKESKNTMVTGTDENGNDITLSLYEALVNNTQFGNSSTLNDILELVFGDATDISEENRQSLQSIVKSFLPEFDNTIEREYIQNQIDYQEKLLDSQINNLNEQKEALENINSQREYENKLIEAKLKLENAQQEKKKVWRAGVGWVYESDQTAIAEAQEELDNLDIEKQTSALQEQITVLEAQKEVLTSIEDNLEFENMKESWDAWSTEMGIFNEDQTTIIQKLKELYKGISKIDTWSQAKAVAEANAENEATKQELVNEAYNTLQSYVSGENSTAPSDQSSPDYADWVTGYNNAVLNYQKTFEENADALDQDWLDTHDDYNKLTTKQNEIKSYVTVGNQKYEVGTAALNENDDIYQWIQEDATAGKNGKHNGSGKALGQYVQVLTPSGELDNDGNSIYTVNTGSTLYGKLSGEKDSNDTYKNFELSTWAQTAADDTIISSETGTKEYAIVKNGQLYPLTPAATGTLDNAMLINELGTEAIVTPQGTITALPSHSGIIPADITRNLWELGEISPTILKFMDNISGNNVRGQSILGGTDESFNVNTINMTVNADDNFDADQFITSLKQRIQLTKHNN